LAAVVGPAHILRRRFLWIWSSALWKMSVQVDHRGHVGVGAAQADAAGHADAASRL
jgi:hypothetical protein